MTCHLLAIHTIMCDPEIPFMTHFPMWHPQMFGLHVQGNMTPAHPH
jgi:hypothetical protein